MSDKKNKPYLTNILTGISVRKELSEKDNNQSILNIYQKVFNKDPYTLNRYSLVFNVNPIDPTKAYQGWMKRRSYQKELVSDYVSFIKKLIRHHKITDNKKDLLSSLHASLPDKLNLDLFKLPTTPTVSHLPHPTPVNHRDMINNLNKKGLSLTQLIQVLHISESDLVQDHTGKIYIPEPLFIQRLISLSYKSKEYYFNTGSLSFQSYLKTLVDDYER